MPMGFYLMHNGYLEILVRHGLFVSWRACHAGRDDRHGLARLAQGFHPACGPSGFI